MRLYRIIKGPLVTEKTSAMEVSNSSYCVIVSNDATKIDIKKAILEIYGIEISRVNIINVRGKKKHGKKGMQKRRGELKKAYITLKNKGDKLDFSLIK